MKKKFDFVSKVTLELQGKLDNYLYLMAVGRDARNTANNLDGPDTSTFAVWSPSSTQHRSIHQHYSVRAT